MKTKLILPIMLTSALAGSSGFGQGTIIFANSSTTLIYETNFFAGTVSAAPLTTTSGIKVALFYQSDLNGSTTPAAMSLSNPAQGNWLQIALADIAPLPGRFSGGQVTTGTDVAPAGNVWLEVVAWDNNQTTYANALQNSAFIAWSTVWSQATGDGGSVGAVPIVPPSGGFTGVSNAPEPSTIALGCFGAVALWLLRRRKNGLGQGDAG